MRCEDVDELRLLGGAPGAAAAAHARGCARCRTAEAPLASVRAALAAAPLPAVSGGLTARVLAAAAPALARNAALAARRRLARALAAGLLPLPLILLFDVWLVRSAYALLTRFLPDALGLWVVVNWAGLLALLLALAYGAIPFLAARQTAALRLRSP
jgi:hypothetical protein